MLFGIESQKESTSKQLKEHMKRTLFYLLHILIFYYDSEWFVAPLNFLGISGYKLKLNSLELYTECVYSVGIKGVEIKMPLKMMEKH